MSRVPVEKVERYLCLGCGHEFGLPWIDDHAPGPEAACPKCPSPWLKWLTYEAHFARKR